MDHFSPLPRLTLFLLLLFFSLAALACVPGQTYVMSPKVPSSALESVFPRAGDWDRNRVAEILKKADTYGSTSLIILHQGRLVAQWGDTAKKTSSHSVRKSLLSALIGSAVDRGLVNLNTTLRELGIDDLQPLNAVEKSATVRDLLMAKSGVYHPAAAESKGMKKDRPVRGAYLPGTHYYYNNWDFNVLGTIFRQRTGLSIGQAFDDWIARPLGLPDFLPTDVRLKYESVSRHPSYPFFISARDLALFGQLYLNKGVWKGQRIIPAKWIKDSTSAYFFNGVRGYGYLWWTYRDLAYYADGFGGQFVIMVPDRELVVVNRVDTGQPGAERFGWLNQGKRVDYSEIEALLTEILAAVP